MIGRPLALVGSVRERPLRTKCVMRVSSFAERRRVRSSELDPGLAVDTFTDAGPPRYPLP